MVFCLSRVLEMSYRSVGRLRIECLYPRLSKPLLDDIDRALASHYGLGAAELDCLLHFDGQYRLGHTEDPRKADSCTEADGPGRSNSLSAAASAKL